MHAIELTKLKCAMDQFVRFLLVGMSNTIIDVGVYNVLAGRRFRWSRIKASTTSATIAIAYSYLANGWLVFGAANIYSPIIFSKYIAVYGVSSYLLQGGVLWLLSHAWRVILRELACIFARVPGIRNVESDLVERNIAKAVAISLGLAWNFVLLRCLVFQ